MSETTFLKTKNRDTTLDFAKGLAILLMLYDHIKGSGWFITSFHMPLFFLISGYLWRDELFLVTLKKRSKSLLIPYVVIDMIALVVGVIKFTFITELPKEEIITYAWGKFRGMFCGVEVWICWFFLAMFFAVVLYAAIKNIAKDKVWLKWLLVFAVYGFGLILTKHLHFTFMYFNNGCIAVLFLAVGNAAREHNIKDLPLGAKISLCISSLILWYAAIKSAHLVMALNIYQKTPLCFLGAICGTYIIVLVSKYARKIPVLGKLIVWCGVNTLPIMCMGNLTRQFTDWPGMFKGHTYLFMFLVQLVLILPIAWVYTLLKSKIKSKIKER